MNSYHLSNLLKETTAQSTLQEMTCSRQNQYRATSQRAGELRAFQARTVALPSARRNTMLSEKA